MFKNIIVKRPSETMIAGITSSPQLGTVNFENALKQHAHYVKTMERLGMNVTVLDPDERYPDSCFVEDTAVLTERCAVITNPGAKTRQKEAMLMLPVIQNYYSVNSIEFIKAPGTLEGGDVMRVGSHFYIGLSGRTNQEGAKQLITILNKYGYTGEPVALRQFLHLKTGITYMENNLFLTAGEFQTKEVFSKFDQILVPADEEYAVNCIHINGTIMIPAGYPSVKKALQDKGYPIVETDTSEYRKIDGGLTCLSLRF